MSSATSLFRLIGAPRLWRSCFRHASTYRNLPEYTSAQAKLLEIYKTMTAEVEQSNPDKMSSNLFERWRRLKPIGEHLENLEFLHTTQQETEELLKDLVDTGDGDDLSELAAIEQRNRENQIEAINDEIVNLLLPPERYDECDVVLELTPGVGGQEAMLFAQDLMNMYTNLVPDCGWSISEKAERLSEQGGLHFGSLLVSGANAYQMLKYEGGIHRVQRVPRTERSGRIHTSTAAVVVTPRTEIDIQINKSDLKIDTFKSSGPGGQHVNTTDSAVRVTHLPTGVVAECQDTRSQHTNRETAIKRLHSKLEQRALEAVQEVYTANVRLQAGSRARSDKIRTYNFVQDRLTDHRIKQSWQNLSRILTDPGQTVAVLDAMQEAARIDRLQVVLQAILRDGWQ